MRQVEVFPGFPVTSEDSLADIGCGSGHNCVVSGEIGASVYAVDTNPDTLRSVEERMRGSKAASFTAKLATSDDIPLQDETASVVVCTEVIEHVVDALHFARELFRIGKPGARYLISVPDFFSESILQVVGPADYFQAPNHVRILARKDFRHLVETVGLEITDEKFVGFYWSIWWALRFATQSEYYPGSPHVAPEVLQKWEATWDALCAHPNGDSAVSLLNRAVPKSQVLLAKKPG